MACGRLFDFTEYGNGKTVTEGKMSCEGMSTICVSLRFTYYSLTVVAH